MHEDTSPMTKSKLAAKLRNGEFVITSEIVPPVSAGREALLKLAVPFKDRFAALNVTDGPGARVHMSSIAASAILARDGFDPIAQVACRDRNRIALQADLLGAAALDIHDVLFLTGDDPSQGDQPDAKPVFDAKSNDLLRWSSQMATDGILPSGRKIDTPPRFFNGAADVPVKPSKGWTPKELLGKADAGAHFIQTQLCYDIDIAKAYLAGLNDHGLTERVYILLGTGPIASAKSARWMNDNLFGVVVPDGVIDRLEHAQDAKLEGLKICVEFVSQLRDIPGIAGIHLMAPGNVGSLPALMDEIAMA